MKLAAANLQLYEFGSWKFRVVEKLADTYTPQKP